MLRISVTNERQAFQVDHSGGPLMLGRAVGEGEARVVIDDRYVSRNQFRFELRDDHRLQVENCGAPVTHSDGQVLNRGEAQALALPVQLRAGFSLIEVELYPPPLDRDSALQTIARSAIVASADRDPSLARLGESPDPATLAGWFETLLSVQRSAAGSAEFYRETAQAVVELVGLDRGLVLLREQDDWKVAARYARGTRGGADFSRSVLRNVLDRQQTCFQKPSEGAVTDSLTTIEAVVASPIFDSEDNIVGVVYGSRDLRSETGRKGIQPIEAQVVQLLAGTVSAGLARVQREREAARVQFQFEQFVSPVLARELERNPSLLEGRDREITVLFSDLRGFARIAERMGPRDTYRLVGDVMDRLTDRVMENGGVIVDYYGDGLEAIWNAPTDQPEHAALACRAALAIQQELPDLNARWQARIGAPLRIGIGINSGPALVGNAGSARRLKYGPRGHTVNLASRVEGATKPFGVPILISHATRRLIADPFVLRKVWSVRVLGTDQPVELYQLHGAHADREWLDHRDQYEQALALFEQRQCAAAGESARQLLQQPGFENDRPTQLLAEKSAAYDQLPEADFDPILRLDSK